MFKRLFSRGFTLIELLVVIVIIAILMAIAIPAYLAQQTKAQDQKTKQYLNYAYRDIRSALPEANNVFQKSTSLVNVVSASEPQLTISSGSCLTLGSAANDALIVDSSTTSNNLLLCAKSASGNFWRLNATSSSAPILADASAAPLSVSGSEVTEAMRTAGVQGDALKGDSSTGVWEASTNAITNGNADSSLVGTSNYGVAVTLSRDATTSIFGTTSFLFTRTNNAGYLGTYFNNVAASPGQTWTFSAWISLGTAAPGDVRIGWDEVDGVNAVLRTNLGPVASSPSETRTVNGKTWLRLIYTGTVGASTVAIRPIIFHDAGGGGGAAETGETFWAGGVQIEQKPIATPYIDTNGSTATRPASSIHFSSLLTDKTQGWAAARIRVEWDATSSPSAGFEQVFRWTGSNGVDTYALHWRAASKWWEVSRRDIGGGWTDATTGVQSFTKGAIITVVGYWNATTLGVSVNGGNFSTVSSAVIPSTMSGQDIYFGSDPTYPDRQLDGEILWEAIGTGTLSNADASTINGFGNSDPKKSSFPTSANATLVWDGVSANASLK